MNRDLPDWLAFGMRTFSITFEKLHFAGIGPTYMIAICPTDGDVHLMPKTIYPDRETFEVVLRDTLHINNADIARLPKDDRSWKYQMDVLLSEGEARSLGWKAYIVQ